MAKKKAAAESTPVTKVTKKRWTVDATFVFGKHIGVFEAETKEEAEALAGKSSRMHVGVCHQCSSTIGGGDIELEELNAEETDEDPAEPDDDDQ